MRWMMLACTNFLVAIFLVSALIVTQTQSNFAVSEKTFEKIQLDHTPAQFTSVFGDPHLSLRNKWIYRGADDATLTVHWKEGKAGQIDLKFPHYVDFKNVSHVEGNNLTALKTSKDLVNSGWMKVGIPAKGLVFQINRDGLVRNMSWHRPWDSNGSNGSKGDILTILSLLRDLPPYAYVD